MNSKTENPASTTPRNPSERNDGWPNVYVWDWPVRVTHWLLAALVLWDFVNDSGDAAHRFAGYGTLALVAFRIFWGFARFGAESGRFSAWLPAPRNLFAYARSMLAGRPPRFLSHNPLGGLMSLAIWTLVIALGVTGFMSYTDAFWGEAWLQILHKQLSNTLVACVIVHVIAAIGMSLFHRENLIKSMITGWKRKSLPK